MNIYNDNIRFPAHLIFILSLMPALAAGLASNAWAYKDGDFQIWHTEAQEVSLNKKLKIPLEEEFRYGDNASELFYHHYDAGLAYDFNKNLSVSLGYRQVYEGEKGKFKLEYQPNMQVTPKWALWKFKFEDRNRLEYRIYEYKGPDIMYRNRIMARLPLKIEKFEFAPYAANEVFMDLYGAIVRQNRFSTGITIDIMKNLKGDVYYMVRSQKKSGRWTDSNILGLKLRAVF